MHALQRRVCSLMPRISYNDILACLICENYRCIPWFRGSCRRGKGTPETDAGHDIPAGLTPERKATALAHAMQGFYHAHRCSCKSETEHIFAILGTSETCDGKTAEQPSFTRICKRPHRLRNGDAALAAAGSPRARQTTSQTSPGGRGEFRAGRATSTLPRSHRRAWGPRCPGRWATYSRRWPRSSPGCRGARARARRAACRPRHTRRAAA